jgi:hypothetical protein
MHLASLSGEVELQTNPQSKQANLCHQHLNPQHHRLTIRNQSALPTRQLGQGRQLHPLHRSFDAAQRMTAQQNLVRGEN